MSIRARVARLWRLQPGLFIWGGLLVALVIGSVFGPLLLPSPTEQDVLSRLLPPGPGHLLGTDNLGRDVLSRLVAAGSVSLAIAAVITVFAVVLGSTIGLLAGYFPRVSALLMRLMDALMSFPGIVLAIALVVSLGSQLGALGLIIALAVVFVPAVARVVRSRTISIATRGYIAAARVSGLSASRILLIHILPNAFPAILVQAALVYASALLADASLSFLGLGVPPPTPTWGNMIADARPYIVLAPVIMLAPGCAIVVAVLSFNMFGDALRSVLDPRARSMLWLNAADRRRGRRSRKAATTAPRSQSTSDVDAAGR